MRNDANLLKLAAGLRGPLTAEFNMATMHSGAVLSFVGYSSCGSVGCALGHGLYLIEPRLRFESWENYYLRVYGLDVNDPQGDAEWEWCFSEDWSMVDNSPEGAADRIEYLVEHGLPTNAFEQQQDIDPISYRK